MELRQLVHFVAVADERSFTRAARRANIVQSGISTSIGALERELGVELFRRTPRGVELTNAGQAFLAEARLALSAVDAATRAAKSVSESHNDSLTVSAVGSLAAQLGLEDVLQELRAAHPDVRVTVEGTAATDFEGVRAGLIDAALGPGLGPPGTTSMTVSRCPICACDVNICFLGAEPRSSTLRCFVELVRSRNLELE